MGTTMPPFRATCCNQLAISGVNCLCNQWLILNDLRRDLWGWKSLVRGRGEKRGRNRESILKRKRLLERGAALRPCQVQSSLMALKPGQSYIIFKKIWLCLCLLNLSSVLPTSPNNMLLIISSWLACLRVLAEHHVQALWWESAMCLEAFWSGRSES